MRLFIAIELNDALRREAARAGRVLSGALPGKYAPDGNLHITLAFLGEVPESALWQTKRAVDAACETLAPFDLSLGECACFGRPGKAILALEALGGPALSNAAGRLRESLAAAGLPFDPKPFRAHVTLARDVPAYAPLARPDGPRGAQTVRGLTLYHSTRANGALAYLPIYRRAFSAPGA